MYFEDEEEVDLDAAEMLLLLEREPELGMDIVATTALEVLDTFKESEVEIADLDPAGRNLFVLCTVIKYMYEQYVLKAGSKSKSSPRSDLH